MFFSGSYENGSLLKQEHLGMPEKQAKDGKHSFLRAELSVNRGHTSQSEFTETETVVSLDGETVRMQMDEKCQNLLS